MMIIDLVSRKLWMILQIRWTWRKILRKSMHLAACNRQFKLLMQFIRISNWQHPRGLPMAPWSCIHRGLSQTSPMPSRRRAWARLIFLATQPPSHRAKAPIQKIADFWIEICRDRLSSHSMQTKKVMAVFRKVLRKSRARKRRRKLRRLARRRRARIIQLKVRKTPIPHPKHTEMNTLKSSKISSMVIVQPIRAWTEWIMWRCGRRGLVIRRTKLVICLITPTVWKQASET